MDSSNQSVVKMLQQQAQDAMAGPVEDLLRERLHKIVDSALAEIDPSYMVMRLDSAYAEWMDARLDSLCKELEGACTSHVESACKALYDEICDKYGFVPQTHIVRVGDVEHEIEGVVHSAFDKVTTLVVNDVPVFMSGAAGAGKNVIAHQVAEALGLEFFPMNAIADRFELTGFIDARGEYQASPLYHAMKEGGLFFLDEMDACSADALVVANMAIANREMAFPGEFVKAHPNFRVIAAGNTLGLGADALYTGRHELDGATLDRFVTIAIDYDKRIEAAMCEGDEELIEFAHAWRHAIEACEWRGTFSYRALSQIHTMQKTGAFSDEEALAGTVARGMSSDDARIILDAIEQEVSATNRWCRALWRLSR